MSMPGDLESKNLANLSKFLDDFKTTKPAKQDGHVYVSLTEKGIGYANKGDSGAFKLTRRKIATLITARAKSDLIGPDSGEELTTLRASFPVKIVPRSCPTG